MARALYDSKSTSIDDRGISKLLSHEAKIQSWLEVEAALARAQAEEGFIPQAAADDICAHAHLECLDLERMERIRQTVGHGFVPFLKVLTAACTGEGAKYVHYGVTTQNIQQTAQLLVVKRANEVFRGWLADILENLSALGRAHADTVMAGRTHGKHAIPITYGYKVAVWSSELRQAVERLDEAGPRTFSVMMGGAVGAFSATGETGMRVQRRVADALGMSSMDVPSRMISSHKVEYVMDLALACHVLHKMAEEVYYTGLEEFGEVREGFTKGTVGSSTMPQKINPKLAKGIIANTEKLYSLLPLGLFANARMFEGDSSSYMQTDALMEEALELASEVFKRAEELTRTLQVDGARMLANARMNKGLDNSEHIMMELAKRLGKDRAHSLVYEKAMQVELEGREFFEVLASDPTISETFSSDEIRAMLDPRGYTGCAALIARQEADRAEAAAAHMR